MPCELSSLIPILLYIPPFQEWTGILSLTCSSGNLCHHLSFHFTPTCVSSTSLISLGGSLSSFRLQLKIISGHLHILFTFLSKEVPANMCAAYLWHYLILLTPMSLTLMHWTWHEWDAMFVCWPPCAVCTILLFHWVEKHTLCSIILTPSTSY